MDFSGSHCNPDFRKIAPKKKKKKTLFVFTERVICHNAMQDLRLNVNLRTVYV